MPRARVRVVGYDDIRGADGGQDAPDRLCAHLAIARNEREERHARGRERRLVADGEAEVAWLMDHTNARARAGKAVGEVASAVCAAIVDDDHLVLPQARDGGENVLHGSL